MNYSGRPCKITGCEAPVRGLDMCGKHYTRFRRHGNPLYSFNKLESRLQEKGVWVGECLEWSGYRDKGYGITSIKGKLISVHRASWELQNGPVPAGKYIDHICHNPACFRVDHLRPATPKENLENHSGPRKDSTSGVRGVFWDKARNKWVAMVGHNGKSHHVGRFDHLEEAAEAVRLKRLELHTFNNLDQELVFADPTA